MDAINSEDRHRSGRLERHRCESTDSLLFAHLDHHIVGNLFIRRKFATAARSCANSIQSEGELQMTRDKNERNPIAAVDKPRRNVLIGGAALAAGTSLS